MVSQMSPHLMFCAINQSIVELGACVCLEEVCLQLACAPPAAAFLLPAGVEVVDWVIPDPHNQAVDAVKVIRDDLKARVLKLAEERGWALKA